MGSSTARKSPPKRAEFIRQGAGTESASAATLVRDYGKAEARSSRSSTRRPNRPARSRAHSRKRIKGDSKGRQRVHTRTSLDGGEGELVEPLRQHWLLRLDFANGLEHGRQRAFVEGHHPAPLLADQPRRGPRVVVEPSLVGML